MRWFASFSRFEYLGIFFKEGLQGVWGTRKNMTDFFFKGLTLTAQEGLTDFTLSNAR